MNDILEEVLATKKFFTRQNKEITIHSETGRDQCMFLQKIISENNFKESVEVGFAYGTSTLAITEIVAANQGTHVVIDKFERTVWENVGLDLISSAGYEKNIEFFEEYSYAVFARFLEQGRKFDFAYIDSTKLFDWLLVDFFFLDKLLRINGIIVFDDVSFLGIRKLLRYITQFPSYKVYRTFPQNHNLHIKLKSLSFLKVLPKSHIFLKSNLLNTDSEMGINGHCVAIQKTAEDMRPYDWHMDF